MIGTEPQQKGTKKTEQKEEAKAAEEEEGKKTKAKKSNKVVGGGTFSQVYGMVSLPKVAFDKILQIAKGDYAKPAKGGSVSQHSILSIVD